MTTSYVQHLKQTPQSEAIPGSGQVSNSAGGFAFPVDDWVRLDRFLILGAEGGSYYATEHNLTVENAGCVQRCFLLDPVRTVARIAQISESGRAPKNDPAIFALAVCACQKPYTVTGGTTSDSPNRALALVALPRVCRTGTHLFQFVQTCNALRGWGRGLRRAIGNWYTSQPPRNLAYQAVKYQQRNGWSHRDLLRLAHPKVPLGLEGSADLQAVMYWIVKGWDSVGEQPHDRESLLSIWAMERAKRASSAQEIVGLIQKYRLVRECIPTQFLKEPCVWEALLEEMPMTAMIRNLATMTRIGLLTSLSDGTRKVISALGDESLLRKAKIHPIAVLAALLTYQSGHSIRGDGIWSPVPQITDALDRAFYGAFGNVKSTGKRWLLALDVSGSMGSGTIAGIPGLTPRVASCALALITAAVEPAHQFVAFTSSGWSCAAAGTSQWSRMGYGNAITEFSVSSRQRLDSVCQQTAALPMGGTDCALPMLWAMENKVAVDAFVVLTDSETWANPHIHPTQALRDYRQRMGIGARMITVGMVSNGFSIADPTDAGSMDVVGFDTSTPQLMANFVSES